MHDHGISALTLRCSRRVVLLVACLTASVEGAEVDYVKDVKPILEKRCVACHGSLRQEGGLRLDAVQLLRRGGDSGPTTHGETPDASLLLVAVLGTGDISRMPAEAEPLPAAEIDVLRQWVSQGAIAADEAVPDDPRRHWSFLPPVAGPVPPRSGDFVAHNPVDVFLNARLVHEGLQPLPEASRDLLLRRLSLDLTGLPPSIEELTAFLADERPEAYEDAVERLLASPAYGERWGRHWMDVWRYSDWYGYQAELRNSARHIWRWRDWIVASLNGDKPYDRMIQEMLAADELDPLNEDALRATGFLARNYYVFNRDVWLDSAVEHTSKAFLGLTMNCAKCHFHMYDPLPQESYYEFRAIFEPYRVRTDRLPGQPDVVAAGLTRVYDADLNTPTYLYVRGNDKQPVKDRPLSPAVPEFLLGRPLAVEPVSLPAQVWLPVTKEFIQTETRTAVEQTLAQAREELAGAEQRLSATASAAAAFLAQPADAAEPGRLSRTGRAELEAWELSVLQQQAGRDAVAAAEAQLQSYTARRAADLSKLEPTGMSADLALLAAKTERAAGVLQAELAVARARVAACQQEQAWRNGAAEKAAELQKAWRTGLAAIDAARQKLVEAHTATQKTDATYTSLAETYPATSSGRRLALARWITDPANPLTARVAVNHVWLRHFGEPLVGSVFDFGRNGQKPTHPELLDWLAVEFQRSGWSMKWLHRQLVTSAAYRRQSSLAAAPAETVKRDPDNRWYWRMTPHRLEAEVVRDGVLAAAGGLDQTLGGPELDAGQGLTTHRRSLYYRHAPEKSMEFLNLFDAASPGECYRRNTSVVPQQALALANSELSLAQARSLAEQVASRTQGDASEFVQGAFLAVLGRQPNSEEASACREYLQTSGADVARLQTQLVHVLFNHNDFVTAR